ncbi:MAG: type III-B CRISPR module RAMP protein Cmr4 [Chlorobi bacterium]|nr:type III-B CRISPR module RAMP protein Cmr4 [Chlorobiota bacterium]
MNITQFYRVETITDAHVGTGESGFGFIDQLIQRDSATGYPCFNSTGMKGAIKQFIDTYADSENKYEMMKRIFGSDSSANKKGGSETQQGESVFFTAHLLALPVRTNKNSFMLTTSPELINFFEHLHTLLGDPLKESIYEEIKSIVSDDNPDVGKCFKNTYVGAEMDIVGTRLNLINNDELLNKLKSLFGFDSDRIAVVSNRTMAELTSDLYLPVISRNALDDGESQNLWYEQILPRFTRLYFANIWKEEKQQDFVENLLTNKDNKKPLQVGGNASVSYGFTSITKM